MSYILLLLMLIFLLCGLTTGHPLAFIMGAIAVFCGYIGMGDAVLNIIATKTWETMQNYSLVALPLFLLMANFLTASGVADGLFDSIRLLFGKIHGGLAIAVIVVSTVFAATTGVVGASVTTMGLLAFPILQKYNYNKELSLGCVAAGGTLGILIPPSTMLVVMGSYAAVSVGKLFLTAIIPGLTLSICYIIYVLVICKRHPEYGPGMSDEEYNEFSLGKKLRLCLINLVPPALLIIGVLGSIFTGFSTPTEAAGVGSFIALLLCIAYRKFSFKMLRDAVVGAGKTTALCFLILFGANAFSGVFIGLGGTRAVTNLVNYLGLSGTAVFIFYLVMVFIMGCFIDWTGILMIMFPIFLPLFDSFGYQRLYILTVTAVLLQTCFLTPPFGYALFYVSGIMPKDCALKNVYKGVVPFICIMVVVTALVILFPNVFLALANRMKV